MLFHDDGVGSVEGEETTVAIGLTGQAEGMLLTVKKEEGFLDVLIKKSLEWWHIEKDGKVTLSVLYFVKVIATDLKENPNELPDSLVEQAVSDKIRETVLSCEKKAREKGFDLYSLEGKYHKKYGEKREPTALALDLKIKVKVGDA